MGATYLRQSKGGEAGEEMVEDRKTTDRHQAADEIFVCGQELSCAKEGHYTMEDAQSVTGFGGQLGNVASQERSCQIMSPKSLNERTSSRGLLRT